jgi:hypothetical protein
MFAKSLRIALNTPKTKRATSDRAPDRQKACPPSSRQSASARPKRALNSDLGISTAISRPPVLPEIITPPPLPRAAISTLFLLIKVRRGGLGCGSEEI